MVSQIETRKILAKKERQHSRARQMFKRSTPKRCSKGEIMREGYHRRSSSRAKSTWVRPGCIKRQTTGRRGEKLPIVLQRGELGQFGYHNVKNLSRQQRHESLNKAIDKNGVLPVYRKVRVLSTLQKRTNPSTSRIFKNDADWIKNDSGKWGTQESRRKH